MKTLSEVFNYLKSLNNKKIIEELDEIGKDLIKKEGQNSDLQYKEHIRLVDNLKNMLEFHFNKRFLKELEGKPIETEEYLKVEEVSKILKTSEVTIRKYMDLGKLPYVDFGEEGKRKSLRVRRSDLDEFMKG